MDRFPYVDAPQLLRTPEVHDITQLRFLLILLPLLHLLF